MAPGDAHPYLAPFYVEIIINSPQSSADFVIGLEVNDACRAASIIIDIEFIIKIVYNI